MKQFKVLIFEDTEEWIDAFETNLRKRLDDQDIKLTLRRRVDDSMFMADIEFTPHLIMIDYDLGTLTGIDILEKIENDPDFKATSIYLYSGGESIKSLREKSAKFKGGIQCYPKEGDDLLKAVLNKGSSI